ncbi:MAG: manganese/iron ABC transporter ATP-binding protein [Geminicoccaceae bacterium]
MATRRCVASFAFPRAPSPLSSASMAPASRRSSKAIMGFVPIAAGEIRILGLSVREALARNLVACVPQAEESTGPFRCWSRMSLMMGRYGHMGFFRRPRPAGQHAVAEALARVSMSDFRSGRSASFLVASASAVDLAREPRPEGRVILLDEPFSGVDVKTEEQIVALLKSLRDEGRVMLVATHNLGSVPEFCDRTVLVKGTVLADGPTALVFTRENLERAFGGVLRHFTLGGEHLHDDDDPRRISVITDDERPLVRYGGRTWRSGTNGKDRRL